MAARMGAAPTMRSSFSRRAARTIPTAGRQNGPQHGPRGAKKRGGVGGGAADSRANSAGQGRPCPGAVEHREGHGGNVVAADEMRSRIEHREEDGHDRGKHPPPPSRTEAEGQTEERRYRQRRLQPDRRRHRDRPRPDKRLDRRIPPVDSSLREHERGHPSGVVAKRGVERLPIGLSFPLLGGKRLRPPGPFLELGSQRISDPHGLPTSVGNVVAAIDPEPVLRRCFVTDSGRDGSPTGREARSSASHSNRQGGRSLAEGSSAVRPLDRSHASRTIQGMATNRRGVFVSTKRPIAAPPRIQRRGRWDPDVRSIPKAASNPADAIGSSVRTAEP